VLHTLIRKRKEVGMQDRRKLFGNAVMVSVIVVVGISPAFAVCPAGKTAVTIVNPANKSIKLCFPDAVVDNIGNGTDIVIPASCP
jgi:putative transposon-encoded protein